MGIRPPGVSCGWQAVGVRCQLMPIVILLRALGVFAVQHSERTTDSRPLAGSRLESRAVELPDLLPAFGVHVAIGSEFRLQPAQSPTLRAA